MKVYELLDKIPKHYQARISKFSNNKFLTAGRIFELERAKIYLDSEVEEINIFDNKLIIRIGR
jgi:hypothetical protein|nr:MAG TPA: hypothetical protein [Caudoviricetes sp.]